MELYIIRHGQSENNARGDDEFDRVDDPELTEIGHEQARHVARFLRDQINIEDVVRTPVSDRSRLNGNHPHQITHLYTSAMIRALQTTHPISEALGLAPEVWVEIHEHGGMYLHEEGIERGRPGIARRDLLAKFPNYVVTDAVTDRGWWTYDGREDLAGAFARAVRVAHALRQRATNSETKDDKIAIVSHGTFIDCLLKALTNNAPSEAYYHWLYNTSITRVDFWKSGHVVMRYMNRVTHLPPELIT